MRILVTGAAGWIGARLVMHLLSQGHEVRAATRAPVPWLPKAAEPVAADLVHATAGELQAMAADVDAIVHLAGLSEVVAREDPDRALSETVVAARRIGVAARDVETPRVVHLSTFHVYGNRAVAGTRLHEDLRPEPRSVYATSRLAAEHLFAELALPNQLVVLRMTNAVGAPADPASDRWTLVANDLVRSGVLDNELRLHTDGSQTRDFVALTDVCHVLEAASDRSRLPAGTYNLGSGRATAVRALAEIVQDEVERHAGTRPALVAPPAAASPSFAVDVDVSRLAGHGLVPTTTLRQAVAETVAFCAANRSAIATLREGDQ